MGEVVQRLKLHMVCLKDINSLEDLKGEELQSVVHADLIKRERVKGSLIYMFDSLLVQFPLNICYITNLKEFKL